MLVGTTVPVTASGPLARSFGAYAEYSDGTGSFVPAIWASSDPNVIVIRDGEVVAVGRGTATLTATAEGRTANETFTVEPGVPGSWSGAFVVTGCQAGNGSLFDLICGTAQGARPGGALTVGTVVPMVLQIAKADGNALTATAQLGEWRGTLGGTDRGANFLTLAGELRVNQTTLSVVYWDARVLQDVMDGFLGLEVRIAGVPSHAVVSARLENVVRR